VACQSQNFWWQRGRKKSNLDVAWQKLEDALNLLLEAAREHFVSLIKHEDLEVVSLQEILLHHVDDAAGCANHNVDATLLKNFNVFLDHSAAHASMDFYTLVLTN